jgi:hypothetical protein
MPEKPEPIAEPDGKSTLLDDCISLLAYGAGHTPITSEPSDGVSTDMAEKTLDYGDDLSNIYDDLSGQAKKPLEGSATLP